MTDFIQQVLDATDSAESPKSYFYWSALAAISAVACNKVYLSKGGYYDLKTNIYVVLKGPSGVRKSYPVILAKNLVLAVGNTRVIDGINSIEKIFHKLSTAVTLENGTMITDGNCLLINDEITSLLLDNKMSQKYLTQIYDTHYHKDFSYDTLSGGERRIKKPYVTILGSTTDDDWQMYLQKGSTRGGFLARFFIQDERIPARINPLIKREERMSLNPLIDSLKEISKIKGEFCWSESGGNLFEEWYVSLREGMIENPDKDKTGVLNRIHDQAIKIAMLLSLARGHELIIKLEDMEDAIRSCTEFMTLTKQLTAGSGEGELSLKINMFLSDLLRAKDHVLTHRKIIQKRVGDLSVEDITKIVELLSQGGLIEIVRGQELGYKLTEKAIQEFGGLLK